ncbi:hypothetical protein, partial [uncultured Pseudomonas sp.]|uniref:hypothetical protein n=1 Tax=uncultured Pseudomonas sp. TaxID=114707 RepID=UPI0027DC181C
NRTGVGGFAIRCITILLFGQLCLMIPWKHQKQEFVTATISLQAFDSSALQVVAPGLMARIMY